MARHIKKTRRSLRLWHRLVTFCGKNGQLLFLLFLMFFGALTATVLYPHLSEEWKELFRGVVDSSVPPATVAQGCAAVLASSFFTLALLALLFLLGLTPYGWPLIMCVPLFFGYVLGLSQCRVFLSEGSITAVLTVFLPMGWSGLAVLIATAQSLQMSALFSRQLLPSSAHCGGLWHDFKWYLLRFLLCVLIALVAAFCKVLLQYL